MTFSKMALKTDCHFAECNLCCVSQISLIMVVLIVIMLNVVAP